jgi:hypothetical protein
MRHAGDLRAVADLHVADDTGMRTHDHEVAEFRRTRNTALGHDYTMAADDYVVGDLHEIVDLRALADDRVRQGTSVDGGVGADLNVVTDDVRLGDRLQPRRKVGGFAYCRGQFRCYSGLHQSTPANASATVLAPKHSATKDNNVSAFLLRKIGLHKKRVRKNAAGDTNALSFRNLAPLTLISEGDIQKQGSPIETGQVINRTLEMSVFKLLLTGVDDSAVVPEPRDQSERLSRSAKIEVIDELLLDYRERLTALVGEDDEQDLNTQLAEVEEGLAKERASLDATEQAYAAFVQRRNDLRKKLEAAADRRSEIDELLARYQLLDAHYASDLARLEGLREAGSLVSALGPEDCPLCGAPPDVQHRDGDCDGNIEAVISATDAETEKITRLRAELRQTIEHLKAEAASFDNITPEFRTQLAAADEQLKAMSPAISTQRAAYSELIETRSTVQNALRLVSSIAELEQRRARIDGAGAPRGASETHFADLSTSTLDKFSSLYEAVLKDWNFPDVSRVYFDKETRDLVISGKPRGSRGKGMRAITHAAFTATLLEFARLNKLPHPGFIVLDTPLLAYREPEGEEDDLSGTDVQDRFYEYLAGRIDRQVIILENVDPPASIRGRDQTTFFSKNPHVGRYGFFPL